MELSEKIRFFRSLKGWTQENVAEKLGISTCAYARIERGETDVNFSRLKQISTILETNLPNLLGLNEKNIFNVTNNKSTQCGWYVDSSSTMEYVKCQQELEKANLTIKYLEQQVIDLREMIKALKR